MRETVNKILEDAQVAYRESIMIDNTLIGEKLLSIMGNTKFILNELETNKNNKKLIVKSDEEIESDEIKKVKRKVPLWLNKPNQYNYKILTTFMKLSKNNKYPISVSLLETHSNIDDRKFTAHYNQMKNISEQNHGKVFKEENGQVSLWNPIEDFVVSLF